MCFFVGNDFLPHLPSLEIREGAISTLSLLWKQCMPMMGGYMTHNGQVDLKRVQILVTELGKMEDTIFSERRDKEERRKRNNKRRKLENEKRQKQHYNGQHGQQAVPEFTFADFAAAPVNDPNAVISNVDVVRNRAALRMAGNQSSTSNQSAAAALKAQLMNNGDNPSAANQSVAATLKAQLMNNSNGSDSTEKSPSADAMGEDRGTKRKADEDLENDEDEDDQDEDMPNTAEETDLVARGKAILEKVAADKKAKNDAALEREPDDAVRLWENGWKERYYTLKFGLRPEDRAEINDVVKSYCEGLCWVFAYYYKGCVSWSWYYPYHYAPMASDFVDIDKFDIKFELSQPFKPFEQLMGVLPAASRSHIPKPFHHLMTEGDSPIIDFYPIEFEVDMDGKKWDWQGVVKLPFIDTKRLLDAMAEVYDHLTEEEQVRNSTGPSYLYISESHKAYDSISTVYAKRNTDEHLKLDGHLTDGLTGRVDKDNECIPRSTFRSPLTNHGLEDIANDRSISVIYMLPELPKDHIFVTNLLRNVQLDANPLNFEDLKFATFEKIDQRRHRHNQGWTPQIQHMEEYREYNNAYPRRGGGRGGRGANHDGSRFPQHQYDNFYNYNSAGTGPPSGQYYPNQNGNYQQQNYGYSRGGGRGGYNQGRGGYQQNYGGYQHQGYQQQQGYNRGGYNQARVGYQNQRGGYNQGHRGGYNNNQQNYRGRGGGYPPGYSFNQGHNYGQ